MLGNRIDMLTATSPSTEKINKKIIVITARAHPVETAGSFVMEGIIEELFKRPLSKHCEELL